MVQIWHKNASLFQAFRDGEKLLCFNTLYVFITLAKQASQSLNTRSPHHDKALKFGVGLGVSDPPQPQVKNDAPISTSFFTQMSPFVRLKETRLQLLGLQKFQGVSPGFQLHYKVLKVV